MDELPPLPKTLNKKEAQITPKVLKWFRENHKFSAAIEIKATKGSSIPKSALEDHQMQALRDAKSTRGLIHKISDESRRKQPFDSFQLVNSLAYVVACFASHGVCLVYDVDDWNGARYNIEDNNKAKFKINI